MRLFVAIDIPEKVRRNLASVLNKLRPSAPALKWSSPANLHITTKFVGEWDVERLEEIEEALDGLVTPAPFEIQVQGVGYFPNPHSPRVFFAGVSAPQSLIELAQNTDSALAGLGVEKETKKYSPHLTLARIKQPGDLSQLRQTVADLPTLDFGSFTADSFCLFDSQLTNHGSVYTKLTDFPFRTEE